MINQIGEAKRSGRRKEDKSSNKKREENEGRGRKIQVKTNLVNEIRKIKAEKATEKN